MFPNRSKKDDWCFWSDIRNKVSRKELSDFFGESKAYLEKIINDVNPRVILATDNAFSILADRYTINSDSISINGSVYPFYAFSSVEEKRSSIEALSELPYQGKEHPNVITIEEMENLVLTGKAQECK